MKGAELASHYAFPPNNLGYCGRKSFRHSLRSFLGGETGTSRLEQEIRGFRIHYAYLKLIARENGLRPFDERVVRAFWSGNSLLESVSRDSMKRFIAEVLFAGKRSARAKALTDNLPDGIRPHHSFNVLYVNFVTDSVERSIKNFDSCCVSAAKVLEAKGKQAIVIRKALTWKDGFRLEERRDKIDLERSGIRLVPGLKKGDTVAVHWGMAVEKLSPANGRALLKYTKKNLDIIRKSLPGGSD